MGTRGPRYTDCPEKLSEEQVAQYRGAGYLAFENLLTADELDRARKSFSELILRARRKGVALPFKGYQNTFDTQQRFYVQYEKGIDPEAVSEVDAESYVRKLMWFVQEEPFYRYLANRHPKLRAILEALMGPEPVLFQEMALIKPARVGGERAWHQDDSYFAVKPLVAVAGVWIALDDSRVENGCMHVLPGDHRKGPLLQSKEVGCTIAEGRIDKGAAVPVELKAGGFMVFSGLLPHFTPKNTSLHGRRAVQFHYRAADSTVVTKDEYKELFAEADGTSAACGSWQYGALNS